MTDGPNKKHPDFVVENPDQIAVQYLFEVCKKTGRSLNREFEIMARKHAEDILSEEVLARSIKRIREENPEADYPPP